MVDFLESKYVQPPRAPRARRNQGRGKAISRMLAGNTEVLEGSKSNAKKMYRHV
jgi:hypothetical protein